jgi:hypothetical protein
MTKRDVARIITELFATAKTVDEFEYACTLLRIPDGMEDAGWDPLFETRYLVRDVGSLLETPLNTYSQLRLVLLYAHLTEFDAIYHMIENLLRVHRGERYTSDPFQDLYSRRRDEPRYAWRPPSAARVVTRLKEHAAPSTGVAIGAQGDHGSAERRRDAA